MFRMPWSRISLMAFSTAVAFAFAAVGLRTRVTATVLPTVVSAGQLTFGLVFSGESVNREVSLSLTPDYDGPTVHYHFASRRKPLPPEHPEYPNGGDPENPGYFRNLCPFLDLTGEPGEGDTAAAAQLLPTTDKSDTWQVHLGVPAVVGAASQDHAGGTIPAAGAYGCDLVVVLETTVGNGFVEPGEECDDGNTTAADGCSASGALEVVVNEILPDPVGSDLALKPDGEWVELYNRAEYPVAVGTWVLYDAIDAHELFITALNTEPATTTIAAGGHLQVFRNGDGDFSLNNASDTVRLYHRAIGAGGKLVDQFSWDDTDEGSGFSRHPDGLGGWVESCPTPAGPNMAGPCPP